MRSIADCELRIAEREKHCGLMIADCGMEIREGGGDG